MRTIKMLGLAVTAALMAMAFVGASSATATFDTALCKKDPKEYAVPSLKCAAQDLISHVHETTLPGNENRAKLLTNIFTIQCHVLFLGDVLTANLLSIAPAPLVITGTFTYNECNLGCSATQLGTAELLVLKTGHELATVKYHAVVLFNCPGLGIHCEFKGNGLVAHALGPLLASHLNGDVLLHEQTIEKADMLPACPSTMKLDILTTPLEHVYITS